MKPLQAFVGTLTFFIWLAIFFTVKLRMASRGRDKPMKRFVEAEREANNARKKEIDPELYYTPDLSVLPAGGPHSPGYDRVVRMAKRQMIRFDKPVTNLELKQLYGPMQLETIAQYEENFNNYLSSLIALAEECIANGLNNDALRILEHTVALGSEYKKSYILTAALYAEARDIDKLSALLETAEAHSFADEGIKRRIIRELMDKRNGVDA